MSVSDGIDGDGPGIVHALGAVMLAAPEASGIHERRAPCIQLGHKSISGTGIGWLYGIRCWKISRIGSAGDVGISRAVESNRAAFFIGATSKVGGVQK